MNTIMSSLNTVELVNLPDFPTATVEVVRFADLGEACVIVSGIFLDWPRLQPHLPADLQNYSFSHHESVRDEAGRLGDCWVLTAR
jgi:hypothetical protein